MNCPKCGTKMKVVRSVLDIPNGIRYRQYGCMKCPGSHIATTETITDFYETMDRLYALHYENLKARKMRREDALVFEVSHMMGGGKQ